MWWEEFTRLNPLRKDVQIIPRPGYLIVEYRDFAAPIMPTGWPTRLVPAPRGSLPISEDLEAMECTPHLVHVGHLVSAYRVMRRWRNGWMDRATKAENERLRLHVKMAIQLGLELEGAYVDSHREYHNYEEWSSEQWERIDKARNALCGVATLSESEAKE
jgi:hypothetical protein